MNLDRLEILKYRIITFNYFDVYTTTAYYITYAQYPIKINPVNKFVITHCVKIFYKLSLAIIITSN